MVLKEGNLLTNVFNRIVRSCFYALQKYYDGNLPERELSDKIRELAENAVIEYERLMYNHEFHKVTYTLDSFIREVNKYWVGNIREADSNDDDALRSQVLWDCFYCVKVITTLLHPFAPVGCEMVREYLGADDRLWSWDYILEPLTAVSNGQGFKFLEPRIDFFKKPEWQLASDDQ